MSESRKNHLTIDGGQVKEDEHVASYKPIPENDGEFRSSKSSLHKKEKGSGDEAEEKLLSKEEEAKIVTRVDMADAKYVVEDHRNGDAKIELDANKRQFTGLTKEELMKYADDPFWVRLRWFMFVLFWAMWLCMLAGAIAIIIRAPKCAPPPPKTWFEKGPVVDLSMEDYSAIERELPLLQSSKMAAVFAPSCEDTYSVLDDETVSCLQQFKQFVAKAKTFGVKVIVDLTANFVSTSHKWFQLSENRSAEYDEYFTWRASTEFDPNDNKTTPKPPNNWVSTLDEPAWTLSEKRGEFYLHQYGADQADLNFHNPAVVREFDAVLKIWMKAGADGIRLQKARTLVVNSSLANEEAMRGRGSAPQADHTQHAYYRHRHTADQPALDSLLAHWARLVDDLYAVPAAGQSVFTLAEASGQPEWFLLERNSSSLRPPSAAPLHIRDALAAAAHLNERVPRWPMIQLESEEPSVELAAFSTLLPAAPVMRLEQLRTDNDTSASSLLSALVALRSDASVEHGLYKISAVPAVNSTLTMLACARWKAGHTGYVSLYNPGEAARADLTALPALPDLLTVHHLSLATQLYTNYTSNLAVTADDVLVPARSALILSYVPKTSVEQ